MLAKCCLSNCLILTTFNVSRQVRCGEIRKKRLVTTKRTTFSNSKHFHNVIVFTKLDLTAVTVCSIIKEELNGQIKHYSVM